MKDNRWTKHCIQWQPRREKRSRGQRSRRRQDDNKEGRKHLEQDSIRQKRLEGIAGGLQNWQELSLFQPGNPQNSYNSPSWVQYPLSQGQLGVMGEWHSCCLWCHRNHYHYHYHHAPHCLGYPSPYQSRLAQHLAPSPPPQAKKMRPTRYSLGLWVNVTEAASTTITTLHHHHHHHQHNHHYHLLHSHHLPPHHHGLPVQAGSSTPLPSHPTSSPSPHTHPPQGATNLTSTTRLIQLLTLPPPPSSPSKSSCWSYLPPIQAESSTAQSEGNRPDRYSLGYYTHHYHHHHPPSHHVDPTFHQSRLSPVRPSQKGTGLTGTAWVITPTTTTIITLQVIMLILPSTNPGWVQYGPVRREQAWQVQLGLLHPPPPPSSPSKSSCWSYLPPIQAESSTAQSEGNRPDRYSLGYYTHHYHHHHPLQVIMLILPSTNPGWVQYGPVRREQAWQVQLGLLHPPLPPSSPPPSHHVDPTFHQSRLSPVRPSQKGTGLTGTAWVITPTTTTIITPSKSSCWSYLPPIQAESSTAQSEGNRPDRYSLGYYTHHYHHHHPLQVIMLILPSTSPGWVQYGPVRREQAWQVQLGLLHPPLPPSSPPPHHNVDPTYHQFRLGPARPSQGVCLLVGCLTAQQHASVSQARICSDNFTCCHTEVEAADQTFYLTQSQYTNTRLTSPSADPITPAPCRVATGVPIFKSLVWLDLAKSRRERDSNLGSSAPKVDALTTRPKRQSSQGEQAKQAQSVDN